MPEASTQIRPGEALADQGAEPESLLAAPRRHEHPVRLHGFGLLAAAVTLKPDPTALPGGGTAEKLLNGATYFVILACVAGALWGLGEWAIGRRSGNYSQTDGGKGKFLACIVAAFLTGALAPIINFFVSLGTQLK